VSYGAAQNAVDFGVAVDHFEFSAISGQLSAKDRIAIHIMNCHSERIEESCI
jgi:hypothetical protein